MGALLRGVAACVRAQQLGCSWRVASNARALRCNGIGCSAVEVVKLQIRFREST